MDLKRNVGSAENHSQKKITAYIVDSTNAQTVENAPATYHQNKKESLTERLKPLLLSLLETQKTEWGYMALNTKEICRRVNGVSDRAFCHTVNVRQCLTQKSWSDKRGCAMVRYDQIPCKFKFQQVRSVLLKLTKENFIETFRGSGLDLKKIRNYKVVSSDSYRFYKIKEGS